MGRQEERAPVNRDWVVDSVRVLNHLPYAEKNDISFAAYAGGALLESALGSLLYGDDEDSRPPSPLPPQLSSVDCSQAVVLTSTGTLHASANSSVLQTHAIAFAQAGTPRTPASPL